MRRFFYLLFGLLTLTGLAAGCGRSKAPAPAAAGLPVEVARATLGDISEEVYVPGTIRAETEATIASQVSARVEAVLVENGDRVAAGQALIRLEATQYQAREEQARAAVTAAQANADAARTAYEIEQRQAPQRVREAQAALSAAQKQLATVEQGARKQEIEVARKALTEAEARLKSAGLLQERQRKLYQEGAVSREQVDDAETAYQVATSQRDSARERLDLVLAGARPEEIDIARAGVEQAQAGLERTRASERQVDVLRHNLDSAQAAFTQALAAHRQALEDLNNTTIRSPIAGTVYDRDVKVGRTAAPGADPLLRIAGLDGMYFEPTVSEMDIASITSGSPDKQVSVEVDALPGEHFEGRIVKVTPQASAGGRDFTLKVSLAESARRLRPGLSARGQITVRQHRGAVIVPKDALVNRAGKPVVFVVEGQVARQRSVEVGIQNRMEVEILSGVRAGESVVTAGHNVLADNDHVQVR